MASKQENQAKENVVLRFIKSSYETGIKASEDISLTAWDIPANILEGMGVGEDKTNAIKNANRKVVGGVYRGVDAMTRKGTSIVVAPFKGVGYALEKIAAKGTDKAKAKPEKQEAVKAVAKAKPKAAAQKRARAEAPKKAKAAAAKKAKVAARQKDVKKKAALEAAA